MTHPTTHLQHDEAIIWQGSPDWRAILRDVFHGRLVAAYLAAQLVAGAGLALAAGGAASASVLPVVLLVLVSAAGLGIIATLAWLVARTTRITITSARVVLRFGIALPATLDMPFAAVEHVGLRIASDHTGDIAIRLRPGQRVGYLKLFPHARAWRLGRPEPMLRAVPHAAVVGAQMRRALDHARTVRAGRAEEIRAAA